jgi:Redoxin
MGQRPWIRGAILAAVFVCLARFAPAQSAIDMEGRAVNPFATDAGRIIVLIFLRRDCPVSGRYAPTIQKISKEYSEDASFFLVYPDKLETPEAIRKSVGEYGYHLPVLRDPDHALVKMSHVQITPEVAVFDRNRKLIYDGRINDWYIDLNRARPAPTTHELEDAIRAAQTGGSLARNEVRGVGCYISDVE